MRIENLPETTESNDDDWIILFGNDGITRKILKSDFLAGITSGGSGGNSVTSFDFQSFGDANGLFYFLGTDSYSQSYLNPATSGVITVAQSSSVDSSRIVENLFDRGDAIAHTNSQANSYFQLDIGETLTFDLKSYTLRNRGDFNGHLPRSWKLQGSTNGINFVDLDVQSGRTDFAHNTWIKMDLPVNDTTSYRIFRLTQTAKNSSNADFFVMGEVEFYGDLSQ